MKKIFSISQYGAKIVGLLLIAAFLFTVEAGAIVSRPQAPLLSLTGDADGYDAYVYPDGRLWIPPSSTKTREILVPVFIQNNFFTFNPNEYIVPPIYSFKFSVFYDAAAVQSVGVLQNHPQYMEDFLYLNGTIDEDPPYSAGWNVNWDDKEDINYWKYMDPETWYQIKDAPGSQVLRGRRMTVTGTSVMPMRTNDKLTTDSWYVLIYLKFKVVGKLNIGDPNTTYLQTPMYIAPDEIVYNDLDVTKNEAYKGFTHIYKNPLSDYPAIPAFPGLGGLDNEDIDPESLFLTEPYKPGSIIVKISDGEPVFEFPSDVNGGYTISKHSEAEYELEQVITIDSGNTTKSNSLQILLANGVERTRLNYISVQTNEPWLFTATEADNKAKRYRSIRYIDDDILGTLFDPAGDRTTDDGPFYLNIICDPTKLDNNGYDEKTGIYYGYITFKSPYAKYENVRLRVKFVYIRPPFEPKGTSNPEGSISGIYMNIRNSRVAQGDSKTLVFGTGHRGTVGVDSLFGEYHPSVGLSAASFDARFFPFAPIYPNNAVKYPNGYGDFSPNARIPYSSSRDIRDYNYNGTHIYYVKFNAGGDANYPVVLTWDTRQFPDGARLFIRDTANGQLFPAVDMRTSTPIDAQGFIRSFTFADASITGFLIEYSLPKEIKYVDQDDKPIIKRGWNLLSLPVRPVNATWNVFYPKAINVPYFFSQNQYQEESVLRPGVGYFVKYGTDVDKLFSGTEIRNIEAPFDVVKVHEGDLPDVDDATIRGGWNAIGGLSFPINITEIEFSKYETASVPSNAYVLKFGVWSYKTDKGYEEVSQLLPGLGYWVKVNSTGYYKLIAKNLPPTGDKASINDTKIDVLNASTKLTIRDNAQHESDLFVVNNPLVDNRTFELPPAPPTELYDVRFAGNLYVGKNDVETIRLQAVTYPVAIEVNNTNAIYTFSDAITGEVYGSTTNNKSVIISKSSSNLIKVEKTSTVATTGVSVYPNPVVSNATVEFEVKETGNVTVKLYNEVGTEIMTIIDAQYNAGVYTSNIDASALSNGSYILKVSNGTNLTISKINILK